jgi:hypothetical protein
VAPQFDQHSSVGILQRMVDEVPGDWLLIGGALAAMWSSARRTTQDIDLVPLTDAASRNRLLAFAEAAALPVEALNSAADFFVRRIPGWDQDLVLLHQGSCGRVFRPKAGVFLRLKLARLSEQDLEDCQVVLTRSDLRDEWSVDVLLNDIDARAVGANPDVASRLKRLREPMQIHG